MRWAGWLLPLQEHLRVHMLLLQHPVPSPLMSMPHTPRNPQFSLSIQSSHCRCCCFPIPRSVQRWWLTIEAGGEILTGLLPGMPDPLDAFQLVACLEGIGNEERLWSLAALTQLRVSAWLAGQACAEAGAFAGCGSCWRCHRGCASMAKQLLQLCVLVPGGLCPWPLAVGANPPNCN